MNPSPYGGAVMLMIINKEKKKKKQRKQNKSVIFYCSVPYLTLGTNKQYRRVNSGGVECSRSSRRGTGLSSASLGSALDSDGQQGHAVVTQKRKLRTPVWARLRNIHISDLTRLFTTPYHDPPKISKTTCHPRYRQYPFHVLTSFSLDLIELVIKGHESCVVFARSLASVGGIEILIPDRSTGLIVKNEYGDGGWKRKADAECFPFDDGSCETISFYAWNFFLFLLACFFRFTNVTNKILDRKIEVLKIILDLNISRIYLEFVIIVNCSFFIYLNAMLCLKKNYW